LVSQKSSGAKVRGKTFTAGLLNVRPELGGGSRVGEQKKGPKKKKKNGQREPGKSFFWRKTWVKKEKKSDEAAGGKKDEKKASKERSPRKSGTTITMGIGWAHFDDGKNAQPNKRHPPVPRGAIALRRDGKKEKNKRAGWKGEKTQNKKTPKIEKKLVCPNARPLGGRRNNGGGTPGKNQVGGDDA